MSNIFSVKRGDTYPNIEAVLSDSNGEIDLTGCSVKFRMSQAGDGDAVLEKDATVVTPQSDDDIGKVYVELNDGDTDTVGSYQAEWRVTFPDGKVATFPRGSSDSFNTVVIQERVV